MNPGWLWFTKLGWGASSKLASKLPPSYVPRANILRPACVILLCLSRSSSSCPALAGLARPLARLPGLHSNLELHSLASSRVSPNPANLPLHLRRSSLRACFLTSPSQQLSNDCLVAASRYSCHPCIPRTTSRDLTRALLAKIEGYGVTSGTGR